MNDATLLINAVGLRMPTATEVMRFGAAADDGCILHNTLVAATEYRFGERGIQIPGGAQGVYMTPDDADHAFRKSTPETFRAGVGRPLLATVMAYFDGGDRLMALRTAHILFETESALRDAQPDRLPAAIRRRLEGNFVRFGNAGFFTDDRRYNGRDPVIVADSEIEEIFARRDELVRGWRRKNTPEIALVS